ncbi:MAG: tetraacyldisaccharide 4'-kinase [Steroidobacteraceae bacterium]
MSSLDTRLQQLWYGGGRPFWLLPLSWLFGLIAGLRRWLFRIGVLPSVKLSRPVIVVGNVTVGGTGKTPLVIWLANALQAQGRKVGVITRGYGGKAPHWPQAVQPDSDPVLVGDESVLIAQQTQALVYAGPDRVAAAQQAIVAGAELVISDDGLQHYRLQRDVELAVVDASRLFGNGLLLPAGPLREPPQRLREVDMVLLNQRSAGSKTPELSVPSISYRVGLGQMRALVSNEIRDLSSLKGLQVHVVTGIGNPQAFIQALLDLGLRVDARVLPDHAQFVRDDIEFDDSLPVLMTEKDAVKCRRFAGAQHWAVAAEVLLDSVDEARLLHCLQQRLARHH